MTIEERQEAAKWFQNRASHTPMSGAKMMFERAAEALSEGMQPHWIPCSVRLPEEDVYVLICYKYKEGEGDSSHVYIDMTSYGQAYFGGRKCSFKEWRSPFEYFHANYEVVAWMPLPKPYDGGDAK